MADDSGAPHDDRRSEPRTAARLEVHFAKADDAARALHAYSLNFSAGGLCLRTRRAYELGTRLELAVEVDGQKLKLVGVVSWSRAGAIGVRFEELTGDDRVRLEAIAALLRRAS